MWKTIKTRNLRANRVKEARLQTLITEFKNLNMLYNSTIDEYAAKLLGIASKSATLGEVMSKHKLVKKFVTRLNIPTGIMTQEEEEDVAHTLEVVDEVEVKDMVRTTRKTKVNVTPQKTMKIMNKRIDYEANLSETHEGDVNHKEGTFFMINHIHETIIMNEEKYTSQKNESNTDEDNVWFGDGSCVSINGKGSILFQGKNREQKLLKDVYYIPALRSNVISLGQATISGYDISIRDYFLTMRDSWESLLIKVPHSVNRLYKAQLKVDKEGTNEVGRESDKEENPHSSLKTVHETSPESEEDHSISNGTPILIARLETIRLLIALATEKGWKIHHLDVKTAFLNGDRKKLDSTLEKMGFLQCVHEKEIYRKVSNEEIIIISVYGDDIFVTGTSLDLINEFRKRMASQFEMSDLDELTYYLSIEVSQGKDCVKTKQERYARKIFKEYVMEDCNATSYPMEKDLKLSKVEDEPEVEGYSDSSHNVDIDDGRNTTEHVFYLDTSPITWCSQKQTTVALSSCEAEFMAATSLA
nr:hypothetical protein [Tanacetum cinerariifolium]